ncbi:MAG: HTTM domain-containing protein [Acidimicrobiales bacterium]
MSTAAETVTDEQPAPTTPWDRFFFEPQSVAPMVLVRAGWGAVMAVWALTLLPDVDPFLTDGALRYDRDLPAGSWNPLDHVGWVHAPLVTCVVLLVAALATMVGYRTRLSSVVAVLCLIALQRTNTTIFNSGDLLLRQVGIAVALAPAGVMWSLDARRARQRGHPLDTMRAPFAMRLLQLELALGYALSAWAKLRGDTWHDGTALAFALRIEDLERFAAPEWLFEQGVLLNLVTWAALLFEASFIYLVWQRRWRLWVLGAGVAFHLGIDLFLDIGYFSIAIWLAYLAFLPTALADRIVGRLSPADRPPGTDDPDDPTEPDPGAGVEAERAPVEP